MQALHNSISQATSRRITLPLPPLALKEPEIEIRITYPISHLQRIMQVEIDARMRCLTLENGGLLTVETVRKEVDMFLSADNPHMERMAELAVPFLRKICSAGGVTPTSDHLFDLLQAVLNLETPGIRVQKLRTALVHDCWSAHIPNMVGTPSKPQAPETAQATALFIHILKIADHFATGVGHA